MKQMEKKKVRIVGIIRGTTTSGKAFAEVNILAPLSLKQASDGSVGYDIQRLIYDEDCDIFARLIDDLVDTDVDIYELYEVDDVEDMEEAKVYAHTLLDV